MYVIVACLDYSPTLEMGCGLFPWLLQNVRLSPSCTQYRTYNSCMCAWSRSKVPQGEILSHQEPWHV
jgi:hypothetical protein